MFKGTTHLDTDSSHASPLPDGHPATRPRHRRRPRPLGRPDPRPVAPHAAPLRTLFALTRAGFPVSHESARRAVRANLPDLDDLADRRADALPAVAAFSARDRRRPWTVALDTHSVPSYGDRTAPGVVGGPKTCGTKFFHGYATAVLLHRRRRRDTVGRAPVAAGQKPHAIVRARLGQITARGLRVGGVVPDAGFDSGGTLLRLQELGVSYVVPLKRIGNRANRRNAWFAWPSGTVAEVSGTTERSRRRVTTAVVVWRGKGEPRSRVFAFRGWGVGSAVVRVGGPVGGAGSGSGSRPATGRRTKGGRGPRRGPRRTGCCWRGSPRWSAKCG
jgi:hypothetical protein